MERRNVRGAWAGALILSVLAGCASSSKPQAEYEAPSALARSSQKADELVGSGNVERAIDLLGEVADDHPSSKEPWVKLAKIHFDAQDYGNAIVAADEALQRDNGDQVAKGIRVVAGLRVAAQSLNDLRNDADLKGTARADAVTLANLLREALGEEVLVPSANRVAKNTGEGLAGPRKQRARVAGDYPVRREPVSSGDPFSVLK